MPTNLEHAQSPVSLHAQEKSGGSARRHVPYRNSLMTTILRDSLGGNTHTVMVATLGAVEQQMDESISTCRFAQRVAKVSNQVHGVTRAERGVADDWRRLEENSSARTTASSSNPLLVERKSTPENNLPDKTVEGDSAAVRKNICGSF